MVDINIDDNDDDHHQLLLCHKRKFELVGVWVMLSTGISRTVKVAVILLGRILDGLPFTSTKFKTLVYLSTLI
jgi:hypothetical protein